MTDVEFRKHLPPYRSLLTPDAQYDYKTHSLVQLSPLDLAKVLLAYQNNTSRKRSCFKMKYRSLLSDVSRKASMLSLKVPKKSVHQASRPNGPLNNPRGFLLLPPELQLYIFDLVDDSTTYKNCLLVCSAFYILVKPFLFRKVSFASTYRFAQFVSYLRLNSAMGQYVYEIDLSKLRPGNWEIEDLSDVDSNLPSIDALESVHNVYAGWRDWKFKNNPSFTLHPYPATPMSDSLHNHHHHHHQHQHPPLTQDSPNSAKRTKFSRYFKRKRSLLIPPPTQIPRPITPHKRSHSVPITGSSSHPKTNKFLMNYSASKDIPIGYIIHLINLCPNITSLDLSSLSLSVDYRINLNTSLNCQHFDLMNNYSSDIMKTIDSLYPPAENDLQIEQNSHSDTPKANSSASSVFSVSTFSKPIRKYNSLLPPLPKTVRDLSYLSKGDGMVFLSDLNLKSINSAHLEMINECEILRLITKRANSLKYVNLSNIIWINLKHVKAFLLDMLCKDLVKANIEGKIYTLYKGHYYNLWDEYIDDNSPSDSLVVDFTGSGMYKNLQWAQKLDVSKKLSQHLIQKVLNDEIKTPFEENIIRERRRMGRTGENYFLSF